MFSIVEDRVFNHDGKTFLPILGLIVVNDVFFFKYWFYYLERFCLQMLISKLRSLPPDLVFVLYMYKWPLVTGLYRQVHN